MSFHFTEADIMLVEKEVSSKSYKDIAFLLDKSPDDVKSFISTWLPGKNIISFQSLLNARPARVRPPREKKKKDPVIISRVIERAQKEKRNRAGEIIFKIKPVDLSLLQSVKVDSKTWIYIKPGEDPVKAKEK